MQTIFTAVMPFLAALVGTGFLIMIFREAMSRSSSRRPGGGDVEEISRRLDSDYWPEPEVPPQQAAPGILHAVDSTLTLSFVVVCVEALAYSAYLYIRSLGAQDLAGALRPDASNLVCLAGLLLVGIAGIMRFREWKQ